MRVGEGGLVELCCNALRTFYEYARYKNYIIIIIIIVVVVVVVVVVCCCCYQE